MVQRHRLPERREGSRDRAGGSGPYLRQGQLVFIDGDPTIRKYIAQDGGDRYAFEIKLGPQSTIKMLGGGKKREEGAEDDAGFDGRHRDPKGNGASEQAPAHTDDDIPF